MCSDTEHLAVLFILHISLIFMSYDCSSMGLGNIETIVLYNQSREMHYDLSLGKFDF